jgi:hypothetical protein
MKSVSGYEYFSIITHCKVFKWRLRGEQGASVATERDGEGGMSERVEG